MTNKHDKMIEQLQNMFKDIFETVFGIETPMDLGIMFFTDAEKFADSVETLDICYTPKEPIDICYTKKQFRFYMYNNFEQLNLFSTAVKCVVKNMPFIRIITSFFDDETYNFIVAKKEHIEAIYKELRTRKNLSKERIVDFPVIGIDLQELKRQTIDFLLDEDLREYCRKKFIPLKRGIVFEGLPGNGKTCALTWLKNRAIENGITYIVYTSPQEFFMDDSISDNETKRIIVFEDFDAFLRERDDTDHAPNQILSQILNLLDGVQKIENVVVIFTTNKLHLFDSAFLRPQRIDKVITFNPPNAQQCEEFFHSYIPEYQHFFTDMLKYMLEKTVHISYAMLKGITDDINIYQRWYNRVLTINEIYEIINDKMRGSAKNAHIKSVQNFIL